MFFSNDKAHSRIGVKRTHFRPNVSDGSVQLGIRTVFTDSWRTVLISYRVFKLLSISLSLQSVIRTETSNPLWLMITNPRFILIRFCKITSFRFLRNKFYAFHGYSYENASVTWPENNHRFSCFTFIFRKKYLNPNEVSERNPRIHNAVGRIF